FITLSRCRGWPNRGPTIPPSTRCHSAPTVTARSTRAGRFPGPLGTFAGSLAVTADASALPRDWSGAVRALGGDLVALDSVLDPILMIRRPDGRYRASLEAVRMRRGEAHVMTAPGLDFAWVRDATSLRPLPQDIAAIVRDRLQGLDPANLSFPEVLALERTSDDRLTVRIAHEA